MDKLSKLNLEKVFYCCRNYNSTTWKLPCLQPPGSGKGRSISGKALTRPSAKSGATRTNVRSKTRADVNRKPKKPTSSTRMSGPRVEPPPSARTRVSSSAMFHKAKSGSAEAVTGTEPKTPGLMTNHGRKSAPRVVATTTRGHRRTSFSGFLRSSAQVRIKF